MSLLSPRPRPTFGHGRASTSIYMVGRRAFTLIELMVVVLIMGILAAIGITSFRGHQNTAKTTQAIAVCRSIGAAQERYRTLHGEYFDVSAGNLARLYPTTSPGTNVYHFWGQDAGNDANNWVELAPEVPVYVRFSFATVAGLPGDGWPNLYTDTTPSWPAAANVNDPWYVIRAVGDVDGDGQQTELIMTSFSDRVYKEGP